MNNGEETKKAESSDRPWLYVGAAIWLVCLGSYNMQYK